MERVAPGGVLLLQYHSLDTIMRLGQWNALRHGHFAVLLHDGSGRHVGSQGLSSSERPGSSTFTAARSCWRPHGSQMVRSPSTIR